MLLRLTYTQIGHHDVVRVLHFIVESVTAHEYGEMVKELLAKGDEFDPQLKKLHAKSYGKLDKKTSFTPDLKLAAASKVTPSLFNSDPLFWAISSMSNYKGPSFGDGPQTLPLAEIVEVAAETISNKSAKDQESLMRANILGTVDDLAALSCITSGLECLPEFKSFANKRLYDRAHDHFQRRLRPHEGGNYGSSLESLKDVFNSPQFVSFELDHAGELLRKFSASKLPQWDDKDFLAQLNRAKTLRQQLDEFWIEMSDKRIRFLTSNSPGFPGDINILPDVMLMQNGYNDEADLIAMQREIDDEQARLATLPSGSKNNKRVQLPAGEYVPFPNDPTPSRSRPQGAERADKLLRIAERERQEEADRIALHANPTPVREEPRPPQPIAVEPRHLEVIARWWPLESRVFSGRRIT